MRGEGCSIVKEYKNEKNENLDLMTSLSDVVQISLNIEQFKCGATESHIWTFFWL